MLNSILIALLMVLSFWMGYLVRMCTKEKYCGRLYNSPDKKRETAEEEWKRVNFGGPDPHEIDRSEIGPGLLPSMELNSKNIKKKNN